MQDIVATEVRSYINNGTPITAMAWKRAWYAYDDAFTDTVVLLLILLLACPASVQIPICFTNRVYITMICDCELLVTRTLLVVFHTSTTKLRRGAFPWFLQCLLLQSIRPTHKLLHKSRIRTHTLRRA